MLREIDPNIVNCHYIDFKSLYFVLLKPFIGYKLVLTCHGSDVMSPSSLDQSVLPYLFKASNKVIGVSSRVIDKVNSFASIKDKCTVVYNGVDVDFWVGAPRVRKDPVIVSVGTLRRVKGQDVLLEAFKKTKTTVPDAQLLIVGSGPAESQLKEQVEAYNLQETVTFTGWLEKAEIRRVFSKSRVFALSSRNEGFCLALLEAMASGLPCVATRVGGIPEVVGEKEAAELVPPENPDALAKVLTTILKDDERATELSHIGHRRAKEFSSESVLDAYEGIFRRVLMN
jgi:glycosyltransferase involved in cell wall biosynthesis